MADTDPRIELLQPPLNETATKVRRNLLASSFVAILIIKTGLIPNQIASLGISFTPADQKTFLVSLFALTVYFVIAFAVYAAADFARWGLLVGRALEMRSKEARVRLLRSELGLENTELLKEFSGAPKHREEDIRQLAIVLAADIDERLEKRTRLFGAMALPIAILRACLDFAFPLVVAVYALMLLLAGVA